MPGRALLLPLPRSWLLAILLLLAVDWYVRDVFVPDRLAPLVDPPNQVLRDQTGGANLGIVFRMAEHSRPPSHRRVVIIGDSTVLSWRMPESTTLAANVQRQMNEGRPATDAVELIELAHAGLPATEASVLAAKALGMGADLVIYSMTPRILCDAVQRTTDADGWVLDDDIRRELGLAYVADVFGLGELARSFMLAHWDLLRFRNEIRISLRSLWSYLPPAWRPSYPMFLPSGGGYAMKRTGPLWTRGHCSLDDSNVQLRALRRIVEMCGQSGRCLLYQGPLNPAGLRQFEPGMMAEFGHVLQDLSRTYGVPLRNYVSSVGVRGFITPKTADGAPVIDALHLNVRGRSHLASLIAADASRLLAERVAGAPSQPIAAGPHAPNGG